MNYLSAHKHWGYFLGDTNKNLADPANIGTKYITAIITGAISIAGIIYYFY